MATMIKFMIILLCSPLVTYALRNSTKALWNLNEMSECRLGYSALAYNDYGCWCGVGGAGTPVDGIDDCCMHHDKCYDAAVDGKECYDVEEEYVLDYSWTCNRPSRTARPDPVCDSSLSGCRLALCECDKAVVDCWSQFDRPLTKKSCSKESTAKKLIKKIIDWITE